MAAGPARETEILTFLCSEGPAVSRKTHNPRLQPRPTALGLPPSNATPRVRRRSGPELKNSSAAVDEQAVAVWATSTINGGTVQVP